MSAQWSAIDDLYADIILALSDEQITSLPHDISLEELIRRFPEVFETTVKSRESRRMSLDPSDGSDKTVVLHIWTEPVKKDEK